MYSTDDDPTCPLTTMKVPAILLTSIQYTKCEFEGEIHVPADTFVYIDTLNSVVLIGDDHVHIDSHEYKIIHS